MATHDEYDKKLLKGIEKIADRIDRIEQKMPRMVEQTENISLPTLCRLAKENNCAMTIHIYPDDRVHLGVSISPVNYDDRIIDCKCSMEDMLDIFKDIIRTAKERKEKCQS